MQDSLFTPKLFTIIKGGLKREQIIKDLVSGLIVGIVALPLAIAFAIASGVSPEKGLVTAIVAGLIISVLGGSRVQIGGPTGAFIVIVYGIVQEHGVNGLTIATLMAGLMLMGMGLAKLGNLIRFIPYPLIVGFTSGIAIVIFSSQIKDFLGLPIETVPVDFIDKLGAYGNQMSHINYYALSIAAFTAIITFNFHRITRKVPGSLVAIVIATLAVHLFAIPVTTIETSYGDIPNHLSLPDFPHLNYEKIKLLIQPAFAIALLGGIESLLSAVVADGMIGGRHRSNMELIAQGAANCFSALFGGIPATGAIARTATNVKNGGRTPIAGITHAISLLLIMLLFAPLARLIPMSCLAGILLVVAYHMSEWRQFVALLRGNPSDILILLVTFILTVFFDLIIAIEIGIVLSSFIVMKRLSESVIVRNTTSVKGNDEEGDVLFEDESLELPAGVLMYEVQGALFFGAAQTFQDAISRLHEDPKVIIIRLRHVPFIDATGIYRLRQIIHEFRHRGIQIILSGVNKQVGEEFGRSNIGQLLGSENILDNIQDSIKRAQALVHEAK